MRFNVGGNLRYLTQTFFSKFRKFYQLEVASLLLFQLADYMVKITAESLLKFLNYQTKYIFMVQKHFCLCCKLWRYVYIKDFFNWSFVLYMFLFAMACIIELIYLLANACILVLCSKCAIRDIWPKIKICTIQIHLTCFIYKRKIL